MYNNILVICLANARPSFFLVTEVWSKPIQIKWPGKQAINVKKNKQTKKLIKYNNFDNSGSYFHYYNAK